MKEWPESATPFFICELSMKIEKKTEAVEMILKGLDILGVKDVERSDIEEAAEFNEIDLSNPVKIDESLILQNRNRSGKGSIAQMKHIAAGPDYGRLGVKNDFGSGSPIVTYGHVPNTQKGKVAQAIMPDGERYKVQYAVVEATDILTSNDVNGSTNKDYFSDDPSHIRAIAGNGRVAGITEAYRRGNANAYREEMANDRAHGVNPQVIKDMKAPILVRIMQPKDVTADIGDRSNRVSGLSLTAVERANNDKARIDFDLVKSNEDGSLSMGTISAFIRQMPPEEQAELVDTDGRPTRQAEERAENAVFAKAYENDGLTRLKTQALEPEAKNIIRGMSIAAPAMSKLAGLPDGYDVRDIVAGAANRAVQAIRKGIRLDESALQQSFFQSEESDLAESAVLMMFAKNIRSAKAISEALMNMANKLVIEAAIGGEDKSGTSDMFGGEGLDKRDRASVVQAALTEKPKKADPIPTSLDFGEDWNRAYGNKNTSNDDIAVMPGSLFGQQPEAPRATLMDSVNTNKIGSHAQAHWRTFGGAMAMNWLFDSIEERPTVFFDRLKKISLGDYYG